MKTKDILIIVALTILAIIFREQLFAATGDLLSVTSGSVGVGAGG